MHLYRRAGVVALPVLAVGKLSRWAHAGRRGLLRVEPLRGRRFEELLFQPLHARFAPNCTLFPSMDTKYRCPSTIATTTGSEIVRPDFRPVTSNVARKLGATPDEPTAAHALFRILAIQLGRCPRYNHRLKSLRVI